MSSVYLVLGKPVEYDFYKKVTNLFKVRGDFFQTVQRNSSCRCNLHSVANLLLVIWNDEYLNEEYDSILESKQFKERTLATSQNRKYVIEKRIRELFNRANLILYRDTDRKEDFYQSGFWYDIIHTHFGLPMDTFDLDSLFENWNNIFKILDNIKDYKVYNLKGVKGYIETNGIDDFTKGVLSIEKSPFVQIMNNKCDSTSSYLKKMDSQAPPFIHRISKGIGNDKISFISFFRYKNDPYPMYLALSYFLYPIEFMKANNLKF